MTYLIIRKYDNGSEYCKASYSVETYTDTLKNANKKLSALMLLNEDEKNYTFSIIQYQDPLLLTEEVA
jgi:hypothetical protein|tara:strand:- start:338 stop:541 length:204 start_codon:yes stop_codon:yes gene_type:complete